MESTKDEQFCSFVHVILMEKRCKVMKVNKKIKLEDLTQWINDNKVDVERTIIRNRPPEKLLRTRKRDEDEQKIMDNLCIKKWEEAERSGKIKYLSKRKWYYEFD